MFGGAVADNDIDEAAFERKNLVITIEVAERGDVFVDGVFVVFDVGLEKVVVWAVAGNHFTFAVGEGMGEADATEFVGVVMLFEVAVAGERVIKEGAEAFADVVEASEGASVVGVDKLGNLGVDWGLAASGKLALLDGFGELPCAVADEDRMVDPAVAVAVFGGFAAEGVDES